MIWLKFEAYSEMILGAVIFIGAAGLFVYNVIKELKK